jgi:uncharacterized protein YkwD
MVADAFPAPRFTLTRARRLLTGAAVTAAAATSLMATAPGASAATRPCRDATTPIAHASRATMQRAVFCLVNRERTERHLPRLVRSRKLDRSAQRWTDEMVGSDDFSHGNAFMNRITAVGFDWTTVGENIATGYATPRAVVAAWMASPGHCANILDPSYREVGTGLINHDIRGASNINGTWTQDFGRKMGQRALSDNDGPAQACYRH